MGIRKFNITIRHRLLDIQSGAKFPANCTDRADVAAADPRNGGGVIVQSGGASRGRD